MASPLPSSQQPIGRTPSGAMVYLTPVWQRFFNAFLTAAPASAVTSLAASPVAITAGGLGYVLVVGGTVSAITLTRGKTVIPTGMTSGFIPVANGDVVTITYSVAPTVTFVPA